MKEMINGRPIPYDRSKEELLALLSSDNMTDFVVACEALSHISEEAVCNCLGSYLDSSDPYRRLAVLKVIFRNPYATRFIPALEKAIMSEDILFAENGLRIAFSWRVAVSESAILTATRRHIRKLYALDALDLLTVHEENYQALTEIFFRCVSSLQQEIVADILVRKYDDAHAAELFDLLVDSKYPKVRRVAAMLGLSHGFDLTSLQNDPDGHVRRIVLGHPPKKSS